MAYLIDTSILARLANTADAQHAVAVRAVLDLHRRGEVLHVTPQVLVEFRSVATRSTTLNGRGLSTGNTKGDAALFFRFSSVLCDCSAVGIGRTGEANAKCDDSLTEQPLRVDLRAMQRNESQ